MRNIYYQSSGNPVQETRLPATLPSIQFLPPAHGRLQSLKGVGVAAAAMGLGTLVTLFIYSPGGITWLEPFDAIFCWPAVFGSVALAAYQKRVAPLCHPVVLMAIVIACASHSTPPIVQISLIACYAGFIVYLFGEHWVMLATALPMPRQTADVVRARCRKQLFLLGAIFAGILIGWLRWKSAICQVALCTLPIAAIGMPAPRRLSTSRYLLICETVSTQNLLVPTNSLLPH